ncbi:hypothetical protein CDL60_23450 [Roseateles noduli]|nr:hypothetical protein CDL60_23450 [Roseateles noduli]
MRLHFIHRNMLVQIPPRTCQTSATDDIYVNAASMHHASQSGSSAEKTQPKPTDRDHAPELTYVQVEFARNGGGKRHQFSSNTAPSETIYATVDCPATAERSRSPELFDAEQRLSKEVRVIVQEFATSNKAGLRNWLSASKSTYGAGAAAKALADRLNGDRLADYADAYFLAARQAGDIAPKELDRLPGQAASKVTLEALGKLTPEQREVLQRHLRDVTAVDAAVAATEPAMSSMAAANARGGVMRAMKDFVANNAAPGAATKLS